MKSSFAYLQTVGAQPKSKATRCLQAAQIVATCWQVFAAFILFFGLDSTHRDRLRPIGLGALMISAGIYSLLLPLYSILREKPDAD